MKRISLIMLLLATPTTHAADCVYIQNQLGIWLDAETNSPECRKDGKMHGQWEEREANGNIATGKYENGNAVGLWTERQADGTVLIGQFVDNKKDGIWTVNFTNGSVAAGPYKNHKRHGLWVMRIPSEQAIYTNWINGERQE